MKNNRSGFTLVEAAVSLAVAVLLITAAGGILVWGNRSFLHYTELIEDRQAGDGVADTVQRELEYAQIIRIGGSGEAKGALSCMEFSEDGRFSVNGKELYGEDFSRDRKIKCRVICDDDRAAVLQLIIWLEDGQGDVKYQTKVVMKPANMQLGGTGIRYQTAQEDGDMDSETEGLLIYYGFAEQKEEGNEQQTVEK